MYNICLIQSWLSYNSALSLSDGTNLYTVYTVSNININVLVPNTWVLISYSENINNTMIKDIIRNQIVQ